MVASDKSFLYLATNAGVSGVKVSTPVSVVMIVNQFSAMSAPCCVVALATKCCAKNVQHFLAAAHAAF